MSLEMGLTSILVIIGLILVIIEIFTVSTLLIWMGLGFFAAAFVSLFTNNAFILIVVGTLVCVATMIIFREKFKNGLLSGKSKRTSYEELIDQKATITEEFSGDGVSRGTLKINGVEWIALASDNLNYKIGDIVVIKKIDGAKMYVSKEEKWW